VSAVTTALTARNRRSCSAPASSHVSCC